MAMTSSKKTFFRMTELKLTEAVTNATLLGTPEGAMTGLAEAVRDGCDEGAIDSATLGSVRGFVTGGRSTAGFQRWHTNGLERG